MKKKWFYGGVVCACVLILVLAYKLYVEPRLGYRFKEKFTFSQMELTSYELAEDEKANVIGYLDKHMIRNSKYIGFQSYASEAVDIDLDATAYGVMLARNAGYELDKEKLQNYIDLQYGSIDSLEGIGNKIYQLYYTMIIDECVNDYNITCDAATIQKCVDGFFRVTEFEGTPGMSHLNNDINNARMLVEIVMEAQLRGKDVHITIGDANKVKKAVKKAMKQVDMAYSYELMDLVVLDEAFNCNLISEKFILERHESFTENGGSRFCETNFDEPQLKYTYDFYVCLSRKVKDMSDVLSSQQSYVETLRREKGVYVSCVYESLGDGHIGLDSILYGNGFMKAGN